MELSEGELEQLRKVSKLFADLFPVEGDLDENHGVSASKAGEEKKILGLYAKESFGLAKTASKVFDFTSRVSVQHALSRGEHDALVGAIFNHFCTELMATRRAQESDMDYYIHISKDYRSLGYCSDLYGSRYNDNFFLVRIIQELKFKKWKYETPEEIEERLFFVLPWKFDCLVFRDFSIKFDDGSKDVILEKPKKPSGEACNDHGIRISLV